MSAERTPLVPGPDHPITVDGTDGAGVHLKVRAGSTMVADTDRALTLNEAGYPAVYYVPLADVDQSVLRPSGTTTYCPYKGEASYYSVQTPDGTIEDALWFYPEPYDAVGAIRDHAAFYTDKLELSLG